MHSVYTKFAGVRRDERGFTLPELLTTIAILGILITIAIVIWLGILEQRRVTAAANQLAGDFRLAHTSATNQLTDWRVVLMPNGEPVDGCSSADYCMLKLDVPYGQDSPPPTVTSPLMPRELPRGTKIKSVTFSADCAGGGAEALTAPSDCGTTSTLEFSSNGTVRTLRPGQSGTIRVSSTDGDPYLDIVFTAATSRIKIDG